MPLKLRSDIIFKPLPSLGVDLQARAITAGSPDDPYGPLADLDGEWEGTGFNVIWRPSNQGQDHFLELNCTNETLDISRIPGEIPNRGLLQPDLTMLGLTYLQQISDSNAGVALHIEPGMWAVVPPTTDPLEQRTIVRMGTIPHGAAILAQGLASEVNGSPDIPKIDIFPFPIGNAQNLPIRNATGKLTSTFVEPDLSTASNFRSPANQLIGITQAMVNDPKSFLRDGIAKQTVTHTTVLELSTEPVPVLGGGTANTAFLQGMNNKPNAVASRVDATLWLETIGDSTVPTQLQYSQTVLLDFAQLSWPHVTVATLTKRATSSRQVG